MKVRESTEKLANYGGKSAMLVDQKVSKIFHDSSSTETNIDATPVDFVEVTIQDLKEFTQEISQEIVDGALGGVEKASLKFLDLTFREPDVHRAILDVLKASLNEKEFIKESRNFGIDLINEAIKDKNFKLCIKQSSLKIVRDEIVKNASIDLIKFWVSHNTIQTYVKALVTDAIINTDAKTALIDSLVEGVIKAVKMPQTNGHIGKLFTRAVEYDIVKNEAKDHLIYNNIYGWISLRSSKPQTYDEINRAVIENFNKWNSERNAL